MTKTSSPARPFRLAREFLDRIQKIEKRLPAKVRAAIPQAARIVAARVKPTGPNAPDELLREIPDRDPMP